MKNYGLFDVTFLFIRLYNVTQLDNKNGWMTFPPDETAQVRQPASTDVCGLPSFRGPCKGYFRRYYFDSTTRECRLFPYGGCFGNQNNFRTEVACQARCRRQESVQPTEACRENEEYDLCGTACPLTCENYQSPPEICSLQCVIGCRCKQGFVRTADLRCVRTEHCPNRPEPSRSTRPELSRYTPPPDQSRSTRLEQTRSTRPDLSRRTRPEQSRSTRPELSRTTRLEQTRITPPDQTRSTRPDQTRSTRPDQFSSTQPELLATPQSVPSNNAVCQQDQQVGPCQGVVLRYYYNKEKGQCEQFNFGGCGGNLNSFPTIEDCNSYCVDQDP